MHTNQDACGRVGTSRGSGTTGGASGGRIPVVASDGGRLRSEVRRWGVLCICGVAMGGCLSAEADIADATVTRQNLAFPGAPVEIPTSVPADASAEQLAAMGVTESGEYHVPEVVFSGDDIPGGLPSRISADMHAESVTVTAREGIRDLSFVTRLVLTVADPAVDGGKPRVLLAYQKDPSSNSSDQESITMPVHGFDDIVNPWDSPESLVYALNVWGELATIPRVPWTIDVSLSFSGSVSLEL